MTAVWMIQKDLPRRFRLPGRGPPPHLYNDGGPGPSARGWFCVRYGPFCDSTPAQRTSDDTRGDQA